MGEFPNKATQFSSTNQPPRDRVGRKKGSIALKTILKKLLASQDVDGQWANPVAKKLLHKAFKQDDLKALIEIIDRIEGRSKSVNINVDADEDESKEFIQEFFGIKKPEKTGEQEK
jgi:hypothetical protein